MYVDFVIVKMKEREMAKHKGSGKGRRKIGSTKRKKRRNNRKK